MNSKEKDLKIEIQIAPHDTIVDLISYAEEFIELIDDFKINFLNNKYFVLAANCNNVLAGILVAENEIQKVDLVEKIVPKIALLLLYVNVRFRNKYIGKKLLHTFLSIQKEKGVASIYVELPQKYKKGIEFFRRNDFVQVGKVKNKITLEINIWNDYGIRDCETIEHSFNDLFN